MTQRQAPEAIVVVVVGFFARHEAASLRLPAGWFGRPHDNLHQLTEAAPAGEQVIIRLDQVQVLTLAVTGAASEGRVLRIEITGGTWDWTEYGGTSVHKQALGAGIVEFHAPYAPG